MSINRPLMSRSCPDTAGTVVLLESAYSVLVRLYGWYQAEDIFEQRMKKCKCKQAWIKFRSGPVLCLLLRVCFFRHVFFFSFVVEWTVLLKLSLPVVEWTYKKLNHDRFEGCF